MFNTCLIICPLTTHIHTIAIYNIDNLSNALIILVLLDFVEDFLYVITIFVYDKLYTCPTRVLNSHYSNCANGSHFFQILTVTMLIKWSFWMIVPNWNMFSQFPSKEEWKGVIFLDFLSFQKKKNQHHNHEHIFNAFYINLHPFFFQLNLNSMDFEFHSIQVTCNLYIIIYLFIYFHLSIYDVHTYLFQA